MKFLIEYNSMLGRLSTYAFDWILESNSKVSLIDKAKCVHSFLKLVRDKEDERIRAKMKRDYDFK